MFIPQCLFQLVVIGLGEKIATWIKLHLMYILICVCLIIMPLIAKYMTGSIAGSYYLNMVVCGFLGCFGSILQASTFGIAGSMPPVYMGMIMLGNGISGIFVNILRIICLAAFGDKSAEHGQTDRMLFFV